MSRAVLAPFEAYQKSRVTFVQTVAELATRPQNIEALQSAGKLHIRGIDASELLPRSLTPKLCLFSNVNCRCDGPVETPPFG